MFERPYTTFVPLATPQKPAATARSVCSSRGCVEVHLCTITMHMRSGMVCGLNDTPGLIDFSPGALN
eukprot:730323-Lingulodinium_polyedra.AAC.1